MVFPLVDADGDVNMYAIPDDDDVEELSLPKNRRYRTLEATRIYRIQQSMTNAVELSDRGIFQYQAAVAQTQTSGHWNSLTGELENMNLDPDAANEVTHLEIPLDKFYDAVFPIWPFDGLTEAVQELVKSEEYLRSLRIYQAGMKENALPRSSPQPSLGSSDEPETEFLNLFNMLGKCYTDSQLNKPAYTLCARSRDEVDPNDDNATKQSHLRMPLYGAFCEDTETDVAATWNDYAFFIDPWGTDFERALLAFDAPDGGSSASRPPDPPAELARCAEEALCYQGNRRHVIGISLDGIRARMWYFDRAGTIRTPPRPLTDPLLAKTIVRLFFADQRELGKELYFFPPPFRDSNRRRPPTPFEDVLGSTFEVQGSFFRITSVLHIARELHGRGTAVYAAEVDKSREEEHENPVPAKVVLKLAWQPVGSSDESELFRLAHEKGVQGLANLYRSCTKATLIDRVRGRLNLGPDTYLNRELRAQVIGPLSIPLYRVQNLETFKKAFISLVRAHHDLYEKAGILHHDVSVNNLMVDAQDNSGGVLIDLDLAVRVKDEHGSLPYGRVHPGTLPFRSIHILRQGNTVHELVYRDDLESFLYSLIWILTYYPFPFATTGPSLDDWCLPNTVSNSMYKSGYLFAELRSLPENDLTSSWLLPLEKLFSGGYAAQVQNHDADVETLGGKITYKAFMTVLETDGAMPQEVLPASVSAANPHGLTHQVPDSAVPPQSPSMFRTSVSPAALPSPTRQIPDSAVSPPSPPAPAIKPRSIARSKATCITCRLRRRNIICGETVNFPCSDCARLRIECLRGPAYPAWLERAEVRERVRKLIKVWTKPPPLIRHLLRSVEAPQSQWILRLSPARANESLDLVPLPSDFDLTRHLGGPSPIPFAIMPRNSSSRI